MWRVIKICVTHWNAIYCDVTYLISRFYWPDFVYRHAVTFDEVTNEVEILDTSRCQVRDIIQVFWSFVSLFLGSKWSKCCPPVPLPASILVIDTRLRNNLLRTRPKSEARPIIPRTWQQEHFALHERGVRVWNRLQDVVASSVSWPVCRH